MLTALCSNVPDEDDEEEAAPSRHTRRHSLHRHAGTLDHREANGIPLGGHSRFPSRLRQMVSRYSPEADGAAFSDRHTRRLDRDGHHSAPAHGQAAPSVRWGLRSREPATAGGGAPAREQPGPWPGIAAHRAAAEVRPTAAAAAPSLRRRAGPATPARRRSSRRAAAAGGRQPRAGGEAPHHLEALPAQRPGAVRAHPSERIGGRATNGHARPWRTGGGRRAAVSGAQCAAACGVHDASAPVQRRRRRGS